MVDTTMMQVIDRRLREARIKQAYAALSDLLGEYADSYARGGLSDGDSPLLDSPEGILDNISFDLKTSSGWFGYVVDLIDKKESKGE
jgi:hypothetical protein